MRIGGGVEFQLLVSPFFSLPLSPRGGVPAFPVPSFLLILNGFKKIKFRGYSGRRNMKKGRIRAFGINDNPVLLPAPPKIFACSWPKPTLDCMSCVVVVRRWIEPPFSATSPFKARPLSYFQGIKWAPGLNLQRPGSCTCYSHFHACMSSSIGHPTLFCHSMRRLPFTTVCGHRISRP